MAFNYYQILGIEKNASLEDIKAAFKKAALLYHPDRNNNSSEANEKFQLINEAYQTLSDNAKKYQYDHQLYIQDKPLSSEDLNYSVRFQTSYNFNPHFEFEKSSPTIKHNKEWSGVLFLISLLFVIITGVVLYIYK